MSPVSCWPAAKQGTVRSVVAEARIKNCRMNSRHTLFERASRTIAGAGLWPSVNASGANTTSGSGLTASTARAWLRPIVPPARRRCATIKGCTFSAERTRLGRGRTQAPEQAPAAGSVLLRIRPNPRRRRPPDAATERWHNLGIREAHHTRTVVRPRATPGVARRLITTLSRITPLHATLRGLP